MKITLAVLFLAGLTIYCKCAAVLSLPPSLIAHAASLDERLKTLKPFALAKDNETQQQHQQQQQQLSANEDEESNEAVLAADLYTNFKNLWHNNNDLSLNLQKRERNTFDDDIVDVAAMQQLQRQKPIATINKNNQNQNGLKPHDNYDNVGHNKNGNNNNHNNNNKNENNISKSSLASSSLPLSLSSAATNMNEATNLNFNLPSHKFTSVEVYDDDNGEWLSPSPQTIDDIFVSPPHLHNHQYIKEPSIPQLKRRELENMPLANAAAVEDSTILNRFLKPSKYWSRQCPLENENNCLQEYYGTLIADRNNALLKHLQSGQNNHPFATEAGKTSSHNNYYNNKVNVEDDIILLLTAEQNLIQFLSWALNELYSYGKFSNITDNGADSYHPGMYMWKKLNLSGRLEPPLLVDEPRYVIVRREYDQSDDENDYKRGLNYGEDPFIPPRGRKHNLPDLDSLLHRYETFVPNRGRRDKIKDIFKYDDLFYPNRGKRQMTTAVNDNGGVIDERNADDNDIETIEAGNERHEMQQHPLLSNELMEYIENLMAKMKRKLQPDTDDNNNKNDDEKLANSFDEMFNRNEPTTRMSTTFQQASPAAASARVVANSASPSLLKKRFKSMINILHNRKQQQQRHHQQPNHYYNNNNNRRQWWKRYTKKAKTSTTRPTNNNVRPTMPTIRSPTLDTNRLQTTLRSMSPLQQLTQIYQEKHQQQQQPDLSPPYMKLASKFMWQQQQNLLKSLAQQFDPLSWHKLQLLLQQQQQQQQYQHHHHQPLLTMRHPRLTALQHLPAIQQYQQPQMQRLATPQETQLKYSYDQLDNDITNDLDNFYNKDID
ncbi:probable serine/threonine-protein kinase irlF isoform X1 [Lucilia cuprina]|uniref:probable serine/threonine-protein kinase irlF isoform X1 n=1 Tax=Lucilia cuprina TaxID=7375 RepID=UPI001F060356|nr:probable serine/threonine-protein kinase irlF isoform X1 [Lucilia cuprina]